MFSLTTEDIGNRKQQVKGKTIIRKMNQKGKQRSKNKSKRTIKVIKNKPIYKKEKRLCKGEKNGRFSI